MSVTMHTIRLGKGKTKEVAEFDLLHHFDTYLRSRKLPKSTKIYLLNINSTVIQTSIFAKEIQKIAEETLGKKSIGGIFHDT